MDDARVRAALIVLGAVLATAGLMLHPADFADSREWMDNVAAEAGPWRVAHTLVAGGVGLLVAGALLWLCGGGDRHALHRAGVALFITGSVTAFPIFLIEAGAVVDAAQDGNLAVFEQLTSIVEGFNVTLMIMVVGFAVMGAAIMIAPGRRLPRWLGAVVILAAVVTGFGGISGNLTLVQAGLSASFLLLAWNSVSSDWAT